MTTSDSFERLSASLDRAYLEHKILRLPDGRARLELGPAQRMVVQNLCVRGGVSILDRHEPSGDLIQVLTDSAASEIAACVERAHPGR
jgi:hypothetical protein